MLRPIRLLTLAAAATCCGCSYLQNRTNDLLDVFRFDVGHGPGLYADARVTDFFASGLGLRSQRTAGMHGRFGFTLAEVGNSGLGIFVLAEHKPWHPTPLLPDDRSQFDANKDVIGAQFLFFVPQMAPRCGDYSVPQRGLHVADVSTSFALVYVGADVGFSPGELIDLLLGFAGIDLGDDDAFGRGEKPPDESPDTPP